MLTRDQTRKFGQRLGLPPTKGTFGEGIQSRSISQSDGQLPVAPDSGLPSSAGTGGGGRGRGGECPPSRTRGDSGASARGGGASATTSARATARATGRWGRAKTPPRPPLTRHWPATSRRGVPSPTPPPTQRAACPPRASLGGHGRATGGGGAGHAHRTCGKLRGDGAPRVVWWHGARRPLALGLSVAVCGGSAVRTPYPVVPEPPPPPPPPRGGGPRVRAPPRPPPPPRTASGDASASLPPPSLPPSPSSQWPTAPPHGGGGGAGHCTRRVERRVVRRRRSRHVGCLLFLCGVCLASAFWGCMLRGCSLRFAPSFDGGRWLAVPWCAIDVV